MALLLLASLGMACSHSLKPKGGQDAAEAGPEADVPSEEDAQTSDDVFTSTPDAVQAATDAAQPELGCAEDSSDGPLLPDGPMSDGADGAVAETGSLWTDAHWAIDGPCSDNPQDLMQVLAASLSSNLITCSRTNSPQYEGYIVFDSEGRVTAIGGWRVPADKEGWVASLAAYRWPCLAGQSIAYGCSV